MVRLANNLVMLGYKMVMSESMMVKLVNSWARSADNLVMPVIRQVT